MSTLIKLTVPQYILKIDADKERSTSIATLITKYKHNLSEVYRFITSDEYEYNIFENTKSQYGKTIAKLKKEGWDINSVVCFHSSEPGTALSKACEHRMYDHINILLKHGANPNIYVNLTPLEVVLCGHNADDYYEKLVNDVNIIYLLLKYGAVKEINKWIIDEQRKAYLTDKIYRKKDEGIENLEDKIARSEYYNQKEYDDIKATISSMKSIRDSKLMCMEILVSNMKLKVDDESDFTLSLSYQ